jgi:NAD(P)-dependent dehydrogenase (short-subunit alcohol dehydrogenase family)
LARGQRGHADGQQAPADGPEHGQVQLGVLRGEPPVGHPEVGQVVGRHGYGQLDGLSPGVPSDCLSNVALNGLTIMLAQVLKAERIAVNSMCPGWVRTEMGGPDASRSVEEGADTAVLLADEAPHKLTGSFFRDRKEIPGDLEECETMFLLLVSRSLNQDNGCQMLPAQRDSLYDK